ncbi:MAG: DUF2304 family protein [Candidatus Moranbacteria bacterium]|nr:DUF2304 family protein [Candidatus Moranbacteria bacterium]OIQ04012.1 MAG: hypothetical protein AUK58_01290 [Candidatus Moranbacteria bacterium CG2_30_41_165]PIP25797.1 MAG: hypothetical protein COX32_01500 [Candidatus Moranbacteria bacterium CG23_combo_of_CG06-09_8_20_14_all_41_28]PIW94328.1 MAG: hypothetical protein COZ86_01660 [Candidatus Moranbacteria bacterium CG_4_8_14_3_um_filter_41_13]PJC00268.1 MAG: hypothetical protein CO075_01530 [Candidatus Moranbacteria bacterium CG_4_9_14_0_8_u
MSIYQIILATVAFLFLSNGILKFIKRERSQTFFKLFLTLTIWGSILFFSLFPKTAQEFSSAIGLGENLNTLIFIGFVIIFIIVFKLLNIIEKLEQNISEIVRKEALEKIDKKL